MLILDKLTDPAARLYYLRASGLREDKQPRQFFVRRRSVKPSSGGHCSTLMVLNVAQCDASDGVSGAMSEVDSFSPTNTANRSRKAVSHSL